MNTPECEELPEYSEDDLRVIVQDWSEADPDQAVAINLARECLRHRAYGLLCRTGREDSENVLALLDAGGFITPGKLDEARAIIRRLSPKSEFPECTDDPSDCPENEGRGCCRLSPQTGES